MKSVGWGRAQSARSVLEFLSSGAEAAVDIEYGAGDEGRLGACKEGHAGCDRFGAAKALQRVFLALGFGEVAVLLRIHVSVDRAGLHHDHGDTAGAEVARRALGVADDRRLA